ncbi:hypothetical protein BRARA_D01700 [Brassica rapa]|nr:hypothetical protein BRARA_D01700 [Brassica rapa]
MALNHVSRLCIDVKKSLEFYTKVLGFVETERPASLDFSGAVGIHLVQVKDEEKLPSSNTDHLEKRLKEVNVK